MYQEHSTANYPNTLPTNLLEPIHLLFYRRMLHFDPLSKSPSRANYYRATLITTAPPLGVSW
jgi:hypothetical protein